MRFELVATVVVVTLFAGAGVGYLAGDSIGHITTILPSSTYTQTVYKYSGTTQSTTQTIFLYTDTTTSTTSTTCTNPPFVGCVPIDVPVVLGASVNESTAARTFANCGILTAGYPLSVVCQVEPQPGTSGTITLNMTSQNGNSTVAFGLYSSSQFVQFNAAYPCLYSANPPDYNVLRCPVSSSGSTYKFDYAVSQSLASQTEIVLTIVVTKTCCWP